MPPSWIWRNYLRYGARVLPSLEEEAVLFGKPINLLTMDELESFIELLLGYLPTPPPGYFSRRGIHP